MGKKTPETVLGKLRSLVDASLNYGDFTLSSGIKSPYMINLKPALLNRKSSKIIGQAIDQEILDIGCHHFAGVELGGLLAAQAIQRLRPNCGLICVRKEDRPGRAQFECGPGQLWTGSDGDVILVEDVVTTGGSVLRAKTILERAGFRVKCIVTLVERYPGMTASLKKTEYRRLVQHSDF